MRVRISYGMDIKDVPSKVNELIHDCVRDLKKICDSVGRAAEDSEESIENIKLMSDTLDRTRKKLTDVDASLLDIQSILLGLDNYYNGEQDVSEGRPTMDSSGNTAEETSGVGDG